MQLLHNIDLGYCTNIHRGESWAETFHGLQNYTNDVRKRVSPDSPYGIGLRLSAQAAQELSDDSEERYAFQKWLEKNNSYVFTINGFPYGKFHGTRVKEQVYAPDWTDPERLRYTIQLFDLICEFAPPGHSVSVSTLPGSFKEFIQEDSRSAQVQRIISHLSQCSEAIERLREQTGRDIHLGLEPEPLGMFENSAESVEFFGKVRETLTEAEESSFLNNIGINYDTCHFAIEYEEPKDAISKLRSEGIRISKIHLSSALKLISTPSAVKRLGAFIDDVYLHQVIVRRGADILESFRDLPPALAWHATDAAEKENDEWRVHFHVPIHAQPEALFDDTRDHVTGTLQLLGEDPGWCKHFEMETYTWEVLPEAMRSQSVVDQLAKEYQWCLQEFARFGLADTLS